ncbi:Ig-like domain-containing protein [Noviherbaspirillum pedocola]|uniref:Bacterial Ig domain-containing protein n=1 Tax=Noviherbaspirillum pedocola TaxID=2801341 RepID=A0A934W975_9BURK|nr:Ig-like domain-containing protein [Noviherbaspirillum pedocola]MBK4737728.1 hypothetical protein [Noviherbaspirillum pedocola]
MKSMKFFCTAASMAVLLAGCGGGSDTASTSSGNSADTPAVTPAAKLTKLTGTAATGAPFAGATVNVIDQKGTVVGTGTTNADGSYAITLAADAAPPFIIQAVRDDMTLFSVVPDAANSTINITPITTLIASRLSVSGDPTKLATELQANPSLVSTTTVTAKVSEVVQILQPLLSAVGTTANPLTGTFTTDGTGMDRALDSLLISFTPATGSSTNIEIAVKQQNTDGSQPLALQFTSQATTLPALGSVTSATLIPAGTTTLIDDLLKRLAACYALPVTERVANPEAITALASDITASACKTVFVNNDPASYLNNGDRIGGADRAKPFSGIFRSGATGLQFDRGAYEFTRANGDLVISFRTVDSLGGILDQSVVVRKAAADGKLYIIGNQYAYPGAVAAYHQLRSFINQPSADHYSTGYVLTVPNDGRFSRVVVTSPKGKTIPLVPSAGSGNLVIPVNGTPSGTNFVRVRGEFADASNSANPATYETTLAYDPDRPSNEEIATFAANSVWRFDYYLAGNSTSTPDATQSYRTQARALTIPEMKLRGMATLTDDLLNGIKTESASILRVPLDNSDSVVTFSWTVPAGAVLPTSLRLFGQGPATTTSSGTTRVRFDDGITVNSTARTGNVPCQVQSSGDNHCAQINGATVFANGSFANGFDLRGSDGPGRTFSHFYATYKILP